MKEIALTLEKCMDIARTYELSQKQLKSMNSGEDPNVCSVKQKNPKKQRPSKQGKFKFGQKKLGDKSKFDISKGEKKKRKCKKCGYDHTDSQRCSAQGKECSFCHKMNHFAKMCLSRKGKYKGQQKGVNRLGDYVYTSSDENDDDMFNDDELCVSMLFDEMEVNKISDEWIVHCSIFDQDIPMQIDTGARCNVISQSVLQKLKVKTELKKTQSKLRSYSGLPSSPEVR